MPFLNYGGPLGSDDAIVALVGARGRARARERRKAARAAQPRRASDRSAGVAPQDHRGARPAGQPSPHSWKRSTAKLRSQVRRPQKEGVTVRFGADQVAPFFECSRITCATWARPPSRAGCSTPSRATFPEDAWFGCAWITGTADRVRLRASAGADEFEMTWASSLDAYKRIAPNMLLYWSFMERAIEAGVRTFNFGRCTPGQRHASLQAAVGMRATSSSGGTTSRRARR